MKLWIALLLGAVILATGIALGSARSYQNIAAVEVIRRPTYEAVLTSPSPSPEVAGVSSGREVATVKRVVDGDTIELTDGRKVRYIGIDTPESVDPRKPVECFGPEATKKNIELVEGKSIELEKDISETDRFGRLLRYIYIDGVMVNDALVREGFASSSRYLPDVKYQNQFDEAQASAKQGKKGMWSGLCVGSTPAATLMPVASLSAAQTEGCVIKGNINSEDEHIYHMPDCGSYDKTQIDPSRGEKYFCTEQEAQSAGWRKAGNC